MQAFRLFIFLGLFCPLPAWAQYIINGDAQQENCHCYLLTPAQTFKRGSVWNGNKINLNQSFDFGFDVFLGCNDANGADGIAFILQPVSTSIGSSGGGLGFQGISPSVGILLDTYQNTGENDPAFDHISINRNGDIQHNSGNNLAGPVQIINNNDNAEDCQWHVLRIKWNATTFVLEAYIDGNLRVQTSIDMVGTVFNNDPMVFWGFSAATGGAINDQKFCTRLNANFNTNISGNAGCAPLTVNFNPQVDAFVPVNGYFWDFGDGTTSTLLNPPPHLYSQPGIYNVKFIIKAIDGCESDTARATVIAGSKPVASFNIRDTCAGFSPFIQNNSTSVVGIIDDYTWLLNGVTASTAPLPQLNLQPGSNQVKLVVKTLYECVSDTAVRNVTQYPKPQVTAQADDGCINESIGFQAVNTNPAVNITRYTWVFADGSNLTGASVQKTFSTGGNYSVKLVTQSDRGCVSDTITISFLIEEARVFAGNDTVVLQNIPFTLRPATNGVTYLWTPSTGLDNQALLNPTATLNNDITYQLRAITASGCEATDEVNIKVFKGSEIYVPGGFTPNGDGLNDRLRPLFVGMKTVQYFRIYNRWGQLIFQTTSVNDQGWDGRINGKNQPTGNYVWMTRATDLLGRTVEKKGTFILIR
jgi:gliding motility-associated-like protein